MSRFDHIRELFLQALELPVEQRGSFLDAACADDPAARRELDGLLAADARGARLKVAHIDPPIPKDIGPYEVLELLGEGGMGAVYKAQQHLPIERTVAIKVVIPGCSTREFLARFDGERQALARMNHPHIATMLDAGATDTGQSYFVMEYVAGSPITTFADHHNLTIRQRLMLFAQVCDAVAHAHAKGIIHRDIKATNVLAYMQDGKPCAKVIDFGIAKALEGDRLSGQTLVTGRGRVIGTYEYMSPEQAQGAPDIGTQTDVYSLGVLLYELLTGEAPFDTHALRHAADDEIRRIIREVEPPRPSTRLSSLGDRATAIALARQVRVDALARVLRSELEWIPLMAMRKERARRYSSPQQLGQDIANYLDRRPLIAGPESRIYRMKKFVVRRRMPLVAGAVAIMGVTVGVIGLVIGLQQRAVTGLTASPVATTLPGAAVGDARATLPIPTPAEPSTDDPPVKPPGGASRVFAEVANGDMSVPWQGSDRAAGWHAGVRDTSVFHSAPASLRLVNELATGEAGSTSDPIRVASRQTYSVSGWYRAEGDIWLDLMITEFDAQGAWKGDLHVTSLAASAEWKPFRVVFLAYPGAASAKLCPRLMGRGTAWWDDITVTPVARPTLVYNGNMTEGDVFPDAWLTTDAPVKRREAVARDTSVFRSAPASLRLGVKGVDGDVALTQHLPLKPGRAYRVSGYMKDDPAPSGVLAPSGWIRMTCRRANSEPIQQTALQRVKSSSGWALFQAEITPPPDSTFTDLDVGAGDGTVWFDDISVEAISESGLP